MVKIPLNHKSKSPVLHTMHVSYAHPNILELQNTEAQSRELPLAMASKSLPGGVPEHPQSYGLSDLS